MPPNSFYSNNGPFYIQVSEQWMCRKLAQFYPPPRLQVLVSQRSGPNLTLPLFCRFRRVKSRPKPYPPLFCKFRYVKMVLNFTLPFFCSFPRAKSRLVPSNTGSRATAATTSPTRADCPTTSCLPRSVPQGRCLQTRPSRWPTSRQPSDGPRRRWQRS